MDVSYKKLWIMLIEKGIKKEELIIEGLLSRATLTKMNKNENVALSVLVNICRYLKCDIGNIMEVLPEGDTEWYIFVNCVMLFFQWPDL